MLMISVAGRLFQARMWREYATAYSRDVKIKVEYKDGSVEVYLLTRDWVEGILQISREECLRRARINVRLARRLNRINHAYIGTTQGLPGS